MFDIFRRKKVPRRKKSIAKPRPETIKIVSSQRQDSEILMKLDAIVTLLRKHDIDVKDRIDQLAVARRVLREKHLDKIIAMKLSQGLTPSQVVQELVSEGACSRATAYRYMPKSKLSVLVSQE